jgi:phosphohistidine phosphatase
VPRCQTRPVPTRSLLLIRHAQAGNAPLDVDRPLTEVGERHAATIGEWLRDGGVVPDHVVVSPARRARQTWERAGSPGTTPTVDPRVYDNTVDDLLAVVREVPDDVTTLVVVGHNPSIGQLAADLDDGEAASQLSDQVRRGFPAGGVVVFELSAPFVDIGPGAATLTGVRWPAR